MILQAKAKIFLQEERGVTETDWFRTLNTFNAGKYISEHKAAFGDLYLWNEETLAGTRSLVMHTDISSWIIFIPLVGEIDYKDIHSRNSTVRAGQVQVHWVPANTTFQVTNTYENEMVNFLQVWLRSDGNHPVKDPVISGFSVDDNTNHLVNGGSSQLSGEKFPFYIRVGKFRGRAEGHYTLHDPSHGVFAFVVQGAFEIQSRLLHARDGLALWDLNEIEFEALSNEAILVLLELPFKAG